MSAISPNFKPTQIAQKDLVFKTLAQTFNTGHNESIIEELDDVTYLNRMFGDTRFNNLRIWVVLIIVSIGTSGIAALIDAAAYNIGYYKKTIAFNIENPYLSFITWTMISIVFVCIGTSFGYFLCPDVDGSGIPETKAIISGVELPGFLLWKTFFVFTFDLHY